MKAFATFFFCLCAMICFTNVRAQVPRQISYQAMIMDNTNQPIADGQHTITISVYNAPTGGVTLYTETIITTTSKGLANVILGATTPMPVTLSFASQRWLGISVDGGAEMTPRTALVAVPYAMHAVYADSVATSGGGGVAGVSSLNGMAGDVVLESGGSTTINKDPVTKKITISSVGGSGTGIGGVQNADGTLTITNSTGPVATINMTAGSIDSSKLAPNAISTTRIHDGAVTASKLADGIIPTELPPSGPAGGDLNGFFPNPNVSKLQNFSVSANVPSNGQVLGWNGANNTWEPTSFTLTIPMSATDGTSSVSFDITNTATGTALKGTGAKGVWGANGDGSGIGVYGISSSAGPSPTSTQGLGVFGTTSASIGVAGTSSAGDGVQGISSSTGGVGVHGIADEGASSAGVLGESANGAGVKASYTGSSSNGTALTIDNGFIHLSGTTRTAYVHTVAQGNINGNSPWSTFLNYPGMASGDIVIVTHVFNTAALKKNIGGAVFDGIGYGVVWNVVNNRWEIYLEDQATNMPVGERFNVLVIK